MWASVQNNSEHKLAYVVTQDFIYSSTDIRMYTHERLATYDEWRELTKIGKKYAYM